MGNRAGSRCALLLFCIVIFSSIDSLQAKRRKNLLGRFSDQEPPTPEDDFDWKLIKEVFRTSPGNVAVSSFSVRFLLNMLYEGTSTHSQTQRELSVPLGRTPGQMKEAPIVQKMQALQTKRNQLSIANRIFADEFIRVTQKYAGLVELNYNTSIVNINFGQTKQAAKEINTWIAETTRGQIDTLVTPSDLTNVVFLLANTISFKGGWEIVFSDNATFDGPFQTSDGRSVQVPFMKQIEDHYYSEPTNLNAQVLRLAYVEEGFSMVIMLPREGTSMSQFISTLDAEKVHSAISEMEITEVNIELPKFTLRSSLSLKPALQNLGIQRIFEDNAELGGIARGGEVPVRTSDIFQKTFIDVDEKGTTASIASGGSLVFTIASKPEDFHANRPFIFFIEEESTSTVVFAGMVDNPAQ